jgi:hypothetical protein
LGEGCRETVALQRAVLMERVMRKKIRLRRKELGKIEQII